MKVFLSYSREDRDAASNLADQLASRGFDVWWDATLVGGDRFRSAIQTELNAATKVIVLWSRHAIISDFVIDEASHALSQGKLVPVTIDGSVPPLGFRNIQTISTDTFGPNIDAIIAALRSTAIRGHTSAASDGEVLSGGPLSLAGSDLGSSIASAERYGVAYWHWLLTMITRPMSLASAVENMRSTSERIKFAIVVIAISVAIAASLGATIPGRPALAGRLQIFVVVSCVWMFWAVLIHLICRLFGGKGDALTAILVTLHTLAFTYLVSNFATFMLWNLREFYPGFKVALDSIGLQNPGTALVLLQAAMLLPLIPLTLGRAHIFSSAIMGAIVAIFAALLAGITAAPIVFAGGC